MAKADATMEVQVIVDELGVFDTMSDEQLDGLYHVGMLAFEEKNRRYKERKAARCTYNHIQEIFYDKELPDYPYDAYWC